jgi:proline iminopeptidase
VVLERRNEDRVNGSEGPDVLDAWRSVPSTASDEAFTTTARRLLPACFADCWAREDEFAPFAEAVNGSYISGLDDCMAPITIDDRARLSSITTPTLVIAGQHDLICGPRWAWEIHGLIPDSRLVVLEDSGHFGHVDAPAQFAKAVVDFVRSTPA